MKYAGMVMNGPRKGERQAWDTPKFETVVLPEPELTFDPTRGNDPLEVVSYDKYTYVWHGGGDGKLPGWYLQ